MGQRGRKGGNLDHKMLIWKTRNTQNELGEEYIRGKRKTNQKEEGKGVRSENGKIGGEKGKVFRRRRNGKERKKKGERREKEK